MKEEEELGVVGEQDFVIRTEEIDEDCLIVAGDLPLESVQLL